MILIKWLTPLPCYGIHGLISTYHVLPRGHSKLPIQNCALAFKFSIHGRQGYQVLPAQCPSCITHGSRCIFFLIEYNTTWIQNLSQENMFVRASLLATGMWSYDFFQSCFQSNCGDFFFRQWFHFDFVCQTRKKYCLNSGFSFFYHFLCFVYIVASEQNSNLSFFLYYFTIIQDCL